MIILHYDPQTHIAAYWGCDKRGEFRPAPEAPVGAVHVLLSGPAVVLTAVTVPVRQRSRVIQAVPYALEENLAQDVEDLHFALGEQTRDGAVTVAVTDHAVMRDLQSHLESANQTSERIYAAVLAVPYTPGGWSILHHGHQALVRTGPADGFAVEWADLGEWLPLALADHAEHLPEAVTVYTADNDEAAALLPWGQWLPGIALEVRRHPHGAPAWLCQGLQQPLRLNLCQGSYRPADKTAALLRPWRLTAVLAGLWLLFQAGLQGYEVQRLTAERQALQAQMAYLYREVFPQARHVVNPKIQLERGLAELRQAGTTPQQKGFLPLLADTGVALAQTPGVLLKRVDYRNRRLDVVLELPTLQALESLQHNLAAGGVTVEIRSANSEHGRVEAHLRMAK